MSIPISPELLQSLTSLSPTQLAWLSGYAWANSQQQNTVSPAALPVSGVAEPVAARKVLVLSASQTGNARRVAESLQLKLEAAGINAALIASGDYKIKQLSSEDILLLVTSTQGEGEPRKKLYHYINICLVKKHRLLISFTLRYWDWETAVIRNFASVLRILIINWLIWGRSALLNEQTVMSTIRVVPLHGRIKLLLLSVS